RSPARGARAERRSARAAEDGRGSQRAGARVRGEEAPLPRRARGLLSLPGGLRLPARAPSGSRSVALPRASLPPYGVARAARARETLRAPGRSGFARPRLREPNRFRDQASIQLRASTARASLGRPVR